MKVDSGILFCYHHISMASLVGRMFSASDTLQVILGIIFFLSTGLSTDRLSPTLMNIQWSFEANLHWIMCNSMEFPILEHLCFHAILWKVKDYHIPMFWTTAVIGYSDFKKVPRYSRRVLYCPLKITLLSTRNIFQNNRSQMMLIFFATLV